MVLNSGSLREDCDMTLGSNSMVGEQHQQNGEGSRRERGLGKLLLEVCTAEGNRER